MAWLQLRLDTSAALAARCEDELLALGAVAVTLQDNADQPLFDQGLQEAPLWNETRVTGLFPAHTDTGALVKALPEDIRRQCQSRTEILEDRDWEREWMKNYRAMQFGPGLWICPSWQSPPDPEAATIMLDPGLAFGTGTHPTTAMCLGHLAELDLSGQSVIDYGCGSGVLAIGALLLGASDAFCVDTDPMAVLATRENAERNNIGAGQLHVVLPRQSQADRQADLVIANILAGPLVELAPTLCGHLKSGGKLLLSGILADQMDTLKKAYAPTVTLELVQRQEDWVALAGVKS